MRYNRTNLNYYKTTSKKTWCKLLNTGAHEKHVPVYTVEGNLVTVKVGEVEHPMVDNHYIEWVSLQTKQGNQRKFLKPGEKPEVVFAIVEGDEVEAVYEYCNLHGLWKK